MSRLAERLRTPRSPVPDAFFARHGLERNPFPPARTIWHEVLYDQDEAIERLAGAIEAVTTDVTARRSIAIFGGTGVGKTHFMRHAQSEFKTHCKDRGHSFATVEFQAGSGRMQDLVRAAFEAADVACKNDGQTDFGTALVDKLVAQGDQTDAWLQKVQLVDLRQALAALVAARRPTYVPSDRLQRFDFDALRDLFRRWLHGASLNPTERKYLPVFGRISTGSMAVRLITELLTLARELSILHGMMLCVDEIETLFAGALKTLQVQGFLQDLRYLFDESSKGERGYALLLLSGSTPAGADFLREVNYPVYQRLGFEEPSRIVLKPISGAIDAKSFALEYVRHEHARWQAKAGGKKAALPPASILSDTEIQQAFQEAAASAKLALSAQVQVSQAPLLEALYRRVEAKRAGPPLLRTQEGR
ncbi:MAG: hypothetical protein HY825_01900 [Acidobacteria bacterium]|nr:hypothetical protein [Acidobacteriota bacterium]